MHFQLAWRNIWRNTKRTIIIMLAIIVGVWSMICLGSLLRGIINQMIQNGIATLTGHIQVHIKGYHNDPVVENNITDPEKISANLKTLLPADSRFCSRVRVNAVANNAEHTLSVTMVGIDPSHEAKVSFIGDAVKTGRYLKSNDKYGIIVGKAFAKKFETKLGRKVVLMSQNVNQKMISKAFKIIGIYTAEMSATEEQFVFINKRTAQEMLGLINGISEISIVLTQNENFHKIAEKIKKNLPEEYEVHTWKELLPIVTAYLTIYDGFIIMWYVVVFIAMAFGIINTTLMAILERVREFGLLKALGMKPRWIVKSVLYESFFIVIIGLFIGNIIGLFSVLVLSVTGIDFSAFAAGSEFMGISRVIYPDIAFKDIITANMLVFILGILVNLYPAYKAAKFQPVEALAHT